MTDEAEAAEATYVLNMIFLVKNGPQYPEKVPKTSHCLAMLCFLREDGVKVTYLRSVPHVHGHKRSDGGAVRPVDQPMAPPSERLCPWTCGTLRT